MACGIHTSLYFPGFNNKGLQAGMIRNIGEVGVNGRCFCLNVNLFTEVDRFHVVPFLNSQGSGHYSTHVPGWF